MVYSDYENAIVRAKDVQCLNKAKRIEQDKIKDGWRFVRANGNTCIFVPCDKNGEPSKRGKEMLEKYRERFKK